MRMKEFFHVCLRVFFIPVIAFTAAMVVPALLVYAMPSLIPVFVILALIGVVASVNGRCECAPRKDATPRKVITFVRKMPAEKS